jgi:hypothetical protein
VGMGSRDNKEDKGKGERTKVVAPVGSRKALRDPEGD